MKWFAAGLMVVLLFSCDHGGLSSSRRNKVERVDRSKRTIIDASEYIDLTIDKNNASMFKKEDILLKSSGSFKIENGNSLIKIDRQKGRITLSSDASMNIPGKQFYAEFSFDVAAANKDCLYVRLAEKNNATMILDTNIFKNEQIPDLVVCIPLYGFGVNRLEVSSVMNGFIGMPSGTYWKTSK
jgi:hypothetical protein